VLFFLLHDKGVVITACKTDVEKYRVALFSHKNILIIFVIVASIIITGGPLPFLFSLPS